MSTRRDYWKWGINTFGKIELKKLINSHSNKDITFFLNSEEKEYVKNLT